MVHHTTARLALAFVAGFVLGTLALSCQAAAPAQQTTQSDPKELIAYHCLHMTATLAELNSRERSQARPETPMDPYHIRVCGWMLQNYGKPSANKTR